MTSPQTEAGPSPWAVTITGATFGRPSGSEVIMVKVPERWYFTVHGRRCLLPQVAGFQLRDLSFAGAAGVGERLHHATWVITGDVGQVRRIGGEHDCPVCTAGTAAAIAWLQETPPGAVREVACGLVYYADPKWAGRHE